MVVKTLRMAQSDQMVQIPVTLVVSDQKNQMVGCGFSFPGGGPVLPVPGGDINFATQDRFHTAVFGKIEQLDGPKNIAMVSYGHGIHLKLTCPVQEIPDLDAAVE
jgi:hypothetical protein